MNATESMSTDKVQAMSRAHLDTSSETVSFELGHGFAVALLTFWRDLQDLFERPNGSAIGLAAGERGTARRGRASSSP